MNQISCDILTSAVPVALPVLSLAGPLRNVSFVLSRLVTQTMSPFLVPALSAEICSKV